MVKENSNKLPMYTENNINALLIEFTAESLNLIHNYLCAFLLYWFSFDIQISFCKVIQVEETLFMVVKLEKLEGLEDDY